MRLLRLPGERDGAHAVVRGDVCVWCVRVRKQTNNTPDVLVVDKGCVYFQYWMSSLERSVGHPPKPEWVSIMPTGVFLRYLSRRPMGEPRAATRLEIGWV